MTTMTKPATTAPPVDTSTLRSFTLRDVPWGQLGAGLPAGQVVTAAEAARRGGLDFQVELLDAGFRSPVHEPRRSPWRAVPHRRAVVRKDTQQFFQFVSADYHPVQYAEAFAFMDLINPEYVAAGTLGGGRQGFLVVKLPAHAVAQLHLPNAAGRLQDDPHDLYVVLRSSHDMSRAIEVAVLPLRRRCMNALALSSFTNGAPQRWSVRHVGNDPLAKLDEARLVLSHVEVYTGAFWRTASELAEVTLNDEAAQALLRRVLPDKPRREDTVNAIVRAWQSPTNGFANTGWGLTNAVGEYFEWGRAEGLRTAESRFTSGLTGPTYRYTNRVAQLLRRR